MKFQDLLKKSFNLVALGFLFLSVSCSHTQRKVSQLDELDQFDDAQSAELAQEIKKDEAKVQAQAEVKPAPSTEPVTENEFAVPAEGSLANKDLGLRTESEFAVPVAEAQEMVAQAPAENKGVDEPTVTNDLAALMDNTNAGEAPVVESPKTDPAPQKDLAKVVAAAAPKKVRPKVAAPEPSQEAVAEDVVNAKEEEQDADLASANMSSLIEENLLWVAFAIVGGVIITFLSSRRNRRSGHSS